jgi:NAD(P)-dependent dehydrogenase (short-subunit alcohol dehydrogenase family)
VSAAPTHDAGAPLVPQSVLVTGAGRGIGRAVALELARRTRMQLVLVSRSERALEAAAECNAVRPGAAEGFVWDVTQRDDAASRALDALGCAPGPTALVHAAAVLGPTGPFSECDVDAWWSAMEVNLGASVRLVRAVLPRMLNDGAGRIVLFSGGGAAYGFPRFSSYGTAKAALVRFTETLAMELGSSGPLVTILAPGAIETDMLAEVRRAGGEVRSTASIDEPCRAVRRLLTEDARGLHGRFVHVRDEWNAESAAALPGDFFKLRRVDGR